MHGSWCFRRGSEDIVIVRTGDVRPGDEAFVVPRFSASNYLEDALHNRTEWYILLSLYAELTGSTPYLVDAAQMNAVTVCIRRALEGGTLVALRRPHPRFVSGVLPTTKGAMGEHSLSSLEESQTSWVEVELLSEDNPPKPIPHVRYRIELPDSSVREGKLDGNGRARLEDIPAGTCTVTFPDLVR